MNNNHSNDHLVNLLRQKSADYVIVASFPIMAVTLDHRFLEVPIRLAACMTTRDLAVSRKQQGQKGRAESEPSNKLLRHRNATFS